MEESFGGFSIREYALKMRSVDMVKCWPFSSDTEYKQLTTQEMAAMLPPMAVTKFRYWCDELEAMKKNQQQPHKDMHVNSTGLDSDEHKGGLVHSDEFVCPVCKRFTANTVKAVNAHIDSCIAQITRRKSNKSKPRHHKKRSIVEIFAETPQIDKAEDDDRVAASDTKSSLKGIKLKRKKKIKKQSTEKKSKELKPCSAHKSTELCSSSCHRRSTLEILGAASSRRKKPKQKYIKKRCTKPLKLISKKQNSKLSSSKILKNCRNVTEQSSSTICNRPGSSKNCPPSSQQLKRHVRFSDKLGALADKEHLAEGLTELDAVQSIHDDNASRFIGKETEVQQASENRLLYGTHDHGKVEHLTGKSVAQSHKSVHDNEGNRTSSERDLYVGNYRLHSNPSEEHHSIISTQAGSSTARYHSSSGKMTDHSRYQPSSMAGTSSLAGGRAYLQSSRSSFPLNENQNGVWSHLSQLRTENISRHPVEHLTHFNPPSTQTIGIFSGHPEWMQHKLMFEEGYNHDNYCGLPLNSQGELIQLGSGSYSGNHHPLMAHTVSGSSTALPFHRSYLPSETENYVNERSDCSRMMQKDQLNLFPFHSYVKENSEAEFPSRSNIANSGISGRAGIICPDSGRRSHMGSDLSSSDMCYKACHTEYDQTPNQRGKEMIQQQNHDRNTLNNHQPTMRLMGKDVAVGQNSKEMSYLEEGKSLADREFLMGYHPSISTLSDYFEKSSFTQSCTSHAGAGNLRKPVLDFSRNHNSCCLESSSMMRREPAYPYINWETNSGLRRGSLTTNQYPSSEQYFLADPPSAPAMFNQAKNFREQCGPVTGFLKGNPQSFVVPSTFQDAHQHMQSRSGLQQTLAKTRGSVFDYPFVHPDNGVNFQESWLQNSKCLPQLPHPAQQSRSSLPYPRSYSDLVREGNLPTTFGICIPSGPDIRRPGGAYDPHNSTTSHILMTNSPFPESVPHPFVPTLPSAYAVSAIDPKIMKMKDAMADPYKCSENKKRPADRGYISTRPSKMLNINAQERLKALENFRTGTPGGTEIPDDLCIHDCTLYRSQTGNTDCYLSGPPKDLLGNPYFIDTSRSVANAKPGTERLTAGAKHLLKPSQNVDQDRYTPIHSAVTYSDSVMEPHTRTFQL